jgi:C4-dicarboxylate-specific signal transduction histidine kinase
MLGEIASSLAHELSQPIAATLSNVQAAEAIRRREGANRDEIDDILDDILSATRRARDIMDRVRTLMFNKVPAKASFDLRDAVREVVDIFNFDAVAKGIDIVTTEPDQALTVNAGRIEMQQVVMNLVLNSVQAISASQSDGGRIDIALFQNGAEFEIRVDDTGPGLSATFDGDFLAPFVTTKETGMGIGLAVSRRIVDRHGGSIEYGTSPTGGARFRVVVPVNEEMRHALSA